MTDEPEKPSTLIAFPTREPRPAHARPDERARRASYIAAARAREAGEDWAVRGVHDASRSFDRGHPRRLHETGLVGRRSCASSILAKSRRR